jgi:hypothetical protein
VRYAIGLLIFAAGSLSFGEDAKTSEEAATPAIVQKKPLLQLPSEMANTGLPRWIRIGLEHRFRFENYTALRCNEGNDDHWMLSRLRATMTITPTAWWSFTFQGQDSRIFLKANPAGTAPFSNHTDMRMAYTDLGNVSEGKFGIRVGRQELNYGEGLLVGPANWGNVSRSFDAVRMVTRRGPVQLDLFAASVVVPQWSGLSHHVQGNNLHGAYLTWNKFLIPTATLEPYFLWRVGSGRGDVAGGTGKADRRVSGVRFVGKLPGGYDYTTETVLEAGHVANSSVSAYAIHLIGGKTFSKHKGKPRVFGMYNYASGDRTPGDGRSETFDQVYAAAHDKNGLADQIGWQNLEEVSGGVEVTPWRRILLKVQAHDWKLAEARDGVYLANGNLIFRDLSGKSGTHIGNELDFVATYQVGARYVGAGYGRIFAGEFLQHQSKGTQLNYVYLNVGYKF